MFTVTATRPMIRGFLRMEGYIVNSRPARTM